MFVALSDVSAQIHRGEVVVVIGPSGSGKSTFLRCLNLLEHPTGGQIIFDGVDITDPSVNINIHRQRMGMVFQHFNLFPHLTVKKNITLAPVRLGLMKQPEADKKAMELALIENLQRQDLNPLEEALGYQPLKNEYGLTQEEAAGQVGKSRPAVANALRLLGLCPEVQERVRKGELSAGHARAILQLKSEKPQQEAAQKIVALGLSVRQAELLCKNMSKEPTPQKKEVFAVDYVAECEKSLSKHLGRGVKIVNGKRKGRFELEFYGQEDLQNLLDALMKIQK